MDFEEALGKAPLTELELQCIQAVHLAEPSPPVHKEGRGRPEGSMQIAVARMLFRGTDNARAIQLSRTLWSAYEKIGDLLDWPTLVDWPHV